MTDWQLLRIYAKNVGINVCMIWCAYNNGRVMHFDMKHATILRRWCRSELGAHWHRHTDFPLHQTACHKNMCTVDYYVALTNYFELDQLSYSVCASVICIISHVTKGREEILAFRQRRPHLKRFTCNLELGQTDLVRLEFILNTLLFLLI